MGQRRRRFGLSADISLKICMNGPRMRERTGCFLKPDFILIMGFFVKFRATK
jgi:hypothetical protein